MRRTLLLGLIVIGSNAIAQNVTIRSVELAGEKMIVTYDLDDSNSSNEYLLNLYSSKDNFATPLKSVTGAVGPEIKPGAGKKMEWKVADDIGAYKGRLSLEVRGKVFLPFVKVKNFDTQKSYKRGKVYDIFWKAGSSTAISVELFNGNQRVQGEMSHPNNGTYSLNIPSDAKPGKDYRVKFTDTKNTDDVVYTPYFKVTPKVPLLLKVLPVAAVGAAVVFLGGKKSGGDNGNGNTEATDIVTPPLPK